jgi:hypothetical protein
MVAVIAPHSILNERKIANALIEHGTQHLSAAYNHALYVEPRAKMMRLGELPRTHAASGQGHADS